MLTVFPNERGLIYLCCPFCRNNSLEPAKLFPIHQPVSMACSCGKTYEFQIENRKAYRKKVMLTGSYVMKNSPGGFIKMTVLDLSLDGCCFLASDNHTLNLGDSIILNFTLDNPRHTRIKRSAKVLRVMGNRIACRIDRDTYDPELGFYVEDFKVPK